MQGFRIRTWSIASILMMSLDVGLQPPLHFASRRPVIHGESGAVACSDPRAAQIGIDVLRAGGNAADAAVSVAAALALTMPTSTGLGGDAFCLFYDSKTKKVSGLNGSGRSPSKLTLELLSEEGFNEAKPLARSHGHCVTVPGAAAAWVDTHKHFGSGKLSLQSLMEPVAQLAESGFQVTEVTAYLWNAGSSLLRDPRNTYGEDLLCAGERPPAHGDIFRNKNLANVLRELGTKGKEGFYTGRIAAAITKAVQKFGGVMTEEDLNKHTSSFVDPISTEYKGVRLHEIPPNGQGIVALMALNMLEEFDLKAMGHNSGEYLHVLTEVFRLAFADAAIYVADSDHEQVPIEELLDKGYARRRMQLIQPERTLQDLEEDQLNIGSDTVYFTVVDKEGNACSFINSNFGGFGTGIVPEGCGFTLQNRGRGFSLKPGHRNCVAANKRPFHTLIPAMLTDAKTGALLASYGIMGGYMQPQGQVQLLLNMLEFGMNPQQALDQPRICATSAYSGNTETLSVESGISDKSITHLRSVGHDVSGPIVDYGRALFGRGHVITRGSWWKQWRKGTIQDDDKLLWAGTDPRVDGLALGY